jgi:hypothetical protein
MSTGSIGSQGTSIECKSFDKAVGVGRVRDFHGVVADVPGLKGVMATQIGFQSGAIKFGTQHGISLAEIREPKDEDWAGLIRKIQVNIRIIMATITDFQPRPSRAFVASIKPGETFQLESDFMSNEPIIFDGARAPVSSYEQLRQTLPHERKTASGLRYFAPFPSHIYRVSAGELEIDGIDIVYDIAVNSSESVIEEDVPRAVVKDVASGDLTFIHNDGQVRRPHG